jgi:hypothetical protein
MQPGLAAFREERRRFLIYGERPPTAPATSLAPSHSAPAAPPSHGASTD